MNSIRKNIVKPIKYLIISTGIIAIIAGGLDFLIANSYKYLTDNYREIEFIKYVSFFAFLFVGILFMRLLLEYLGKKMDIMVEKEISNKILERLFFENIQDIEYNGISKYISLYSQDAPRVSNFPSRVYIPFISGAIGFILALIYGIYNSWILTLIVILTSVSSILIIRYFDKKIVLKNEKFMQSLDLLNKYTSFIKNNQLIIKSYRCEDFVKRKLENGVEQYNDTTIERAKLNGTMRSVSIGMGLLFNTLWMVVGIFMIRGGYLNLGSFIGFMYFSSAFNWPFFEMTNLWNEYVDIKVSLARIMEYDKEQGENHYKKRERIGFNLLETKDLEFKYPDGKIIKYPDITIKEKEWVAITGKSGSGKTTFLKLLLGLYKPSSGEIRYNKNLKPEEFSENIGYVPQINLIFNDNLSYNLNLDNSKELSKLQNELLTRFGLENIDTTIFENPEKDLGTNFENTISGGQKQRLGIIRALGKGYNILILDEITSALDEENAKKILEFLKTLGVTVVMVTHKTDSMEYYDREVRIDG